MILTPFQKLPKNVGDLGKLIVATGFEKLPKVRLIAQSGHTGGWPDMYTLENIYDHNGVETLVTPGH